MLRCWGDECVLYNVASGDTHLIGQFAAHILLRLQQGSADSLMLAKCLAEDDTEQAIAKIGASVEVVLADFEKYKLIQWDPS